MKKLALFDIDGTVLPGGFGIFFIAENLAKSGLFNSKYLEEILELRNKYRASLIPFSYFSPQVMKQLVQGFKGQRYSVVNSLSKKHLLTLEGYFYPYVKEVIRKIRKTHDIYFITANTQFYASFFTNYYKATGYKASILQVKNDKFTGKISGPNFHPKHKKQAIGELIQSYGKIGSIAFGDAETDSLMLSEVETPICINPTTPLKEIALKRGWTITDHLNAKKIFRSLLKS
ncbi:MAG: haloacid dehalogenase-like hydrolase [Patescibacteria group bacterium]|nr:haloacid dehalogenase-like hydrolase [Patescibacteria group bacterium]